jgi:hypothetical protein
VDKRKSDDAMQLHRRSFSYPQKMAGLFSAYNKNVLKGTAHCYYQEFFMPICVICDDTGLQRTDSDNPVFCICALGNQARHQREFNYSRPQGSTQPQPVSFIDIANLEDVNASVDAMRASLLGTGSQEADASIRPSVAALLYHVAHTGHEVSAYEATQLYEIARALEGFLGALAPLGRKLKR